MRKIALSLTLLCLAGAAEAANLDVVTVGAPAINCKFDTDCKITVADTVANFSWHGLPPGHGFLQSRTWPVGQPGTPGAKLHAYLYRIDLTKWMGADSGPAVIPCVKELRTPFGPVAQVDYDGNGDKDQVFVITQGGLGSVKPSSVDLTANQLTFKFFPPVCGSIAPGKGQTTFFIGLASPQPPQPVTAQVFSDVVLKPFALNARAAKVVP